MALPETAHLLDLNLSCPHNSEKGEADEQIQEAVACNMALPISYNPGGEVPISRAKGTVAEEVYKSTFAHGNISVSTLICKRFTPFW